MSKKTFLCDLSMLPSSWGDKSVSIQFFQAILNKGYDLKVICDNWNNPGQGITFDSDSGEEIVDKSSSITSDITNEIALHGMSFTKKPPLTAERCFLTQFCS